MAGARKTTLTVWLDDAGQQHDTETKAIQASAFLALYKEIEERCAYGQIEPDAVLELLVRKAALVRTYLDASEKMLADVMKAD